MGPLLKAYLKPRIPLLFHLSIVGHSTLALFKEGRDLQKLKVAIYEGLYWRMSKIAKVVISKKGGVRALCSLCFQQITSVRFFEYLFGSQTGCFPARLGVVNTAPFCCDCRFFTTSCNAISAT